MTSPADLQSKLKRISRPADVPTTTVDDAVAALIQAATAEGQAWALHSLPTGDDSTYADYSRASEARVHAMDDVTEAVSLYVKAELDRMLAAAPGVEESIEAYGDTCYERGHVHAGGQPSGQPTDRDAAEIVLRTAIAGTIKHGFQLQLRKLVPSPMCDQCGMALDDVPARTCDRHPKLRPCLVCGQTGWKCRRSTNLSHIDSDGEHRLTKCEMAKLRADMQKVVP